VIFSFTIIGVIIGIPLIVIGIVLLVSWRNQKTKEMVREAARELGKGFHEGTQETTKKQE